MRKTVSDTLALMPAAVRKWVRIYITLSAGRGKIMLAISRLHPRRAGDTTWAVVDNARRMGMVNLNDRRRVSTRRPPGIGLDDFVSLDCAERDDVAEASRDLVLMATRRMDRVSTYHR